MRFSENTIPTDEITPDDGIIPTDEITPDDRNIPTDEITLDGGNIPADEVTPNDGNISTDEITPDDRNIPTDEITLDDGNIPADEVTPNDGNIPADEVTPNEGNIPADEIAPDDKYIPADVFVSVDEYILEADSIPVDVADFNGKVIPSGVTNAAFIDLNTGWIDFLNNITAEEYTADPSRVNFYYTHNKRGNSDNTHINDYGANQAAYIFVQQVKSAYETGITAAAGSSEYIQAQVLETLYNDYTTNRIYVQPDTVSEDVIRAGQPANNSHYPQRFMAEEKPPYPVVIDEIQMTDGVLTTANVSIVDELTSYAKVGIKITGSNGTAQTVWTTDHLDNTSHHKGSSATLNFLPADIIMSDSAAYEALVYPVSMDAQAVYDGVSAAISAPYNFEVKNGRVFRDLSRGIVGTASEEYYAHNKNGGLVSDATDGDHNSYYIPKSGTNEAWITVDLGNSAQIEKIDLYSWGAFTYTIELSNNGTDFTVQKTGSAGTSGATEETVTLETPVGARYIKVTMDNLNSTGWTAIGFDVYGYTGEDPVKIPGETRPDPEPEQTMENLSLNKPVTGQHANNNKNPYTNAVDGKHTTCAGPSSAAGETWFQVDLETVAMIDHIDLYGWGNYNYSKTS